MHLDDFIVSSIKFLFIMPFSGDMQDIPFVFVQSKNFDINWSE